MKTWVMQFDSNLTAFQVSSLTIHTRSAIFNPVAPDVSGQTINQVLISHWTNCQNSFTSVPMDIAYNMVVLESDQSEKPSKPNKSPGSPKLENSIGMSESFSIKQCFFTELQAGVWCQADAGGVGVGDK